MVNKSTASEINLQFPQNTRTVMHRSCSFDIRAAKIKLIIIFSLDSSYHIHWTKKVKDHIL